VGVIHGDVGLLVAGTAGGAQTTIAGDPIADTLETGQPLGVHMDHLAGPLPLVTAHRRPGLQIQQTTQTERLEHPAHRGQGCLHFAGEQAQNAALVL
jgi:hypothetical protein